MFTGNKDKAKKEYIAYLKEYHPDKHIGDERYNEVTKKINNLYQKAIEMLDSGHWVEVGLIRIKSIDGQKFTMKYNVEHSFELGKCYIGNNSILYLIDEEHSDFVENALSKINNLNYANDDMKTEFQKYLPNILKKFETFDKKTVILIKKTEDVFSLKDILKYYNGKVPPRHVVWILSSLYNMACFLYVNKLSHNGITIDNYYISPLYHSGLLLGGWWYTVPLGDKMLGVPADIYSVMSPEMQTLKKGDYLIDLEAIRLIGRTLLGDKNGIELLDDKEIPTPLINWVRGLPVNNPMKEYKQWEKVILDSYGKREFIVMNIDINKMYK